MDASDITCKGFRCPKAGCEQLFPTQQVLLDHQNEVHGTGDATTTPTPEEADSKDREGDVDRAQEHSSKFDSDSSVEEDNSDQELVEGPEDDNNSIDDMSADLSATSLGPSSPINPTSTIVDQVHSPITEYDSSPRNSRPRTFSYDSCLSTALESMYSGSSLAGDSDGESNHFTLRRDR